MIDPLLVGLTTVSIALLAASGREPDERAADRRRRFALGAAALALGWLTKGPLAALVVGLALAGGEGFRVTLTKRDARLLAAGVALLFAYLLWSAGHEPDARIRRDAFARSVALPLVALGVAGLRRALAVQEDTGEYAALLRRAGALAAVVLVVAVAWFGAAFAIGGADFGWNLLREQTVGRVLDNPQHQKPWYYFGPMLLALLPVVIFAIPGAWLQRSGALSEFFRGLGSRIPGLGALRGTWLQPEGRARSRLGTFALGWFVLLLVFFSWSKTKRSYYLMPAYPAVALLAACAYERLEARASLRAFFRAAHVAIFAVLALAVALVPVLALAEPRLQDPLVRVLPGALLGLVAFGAFAWREKLDLALVAGSAFAIVAVTSQLPELFRAAGQRFGHQAFARALLASGVQRGRVECATHREALCWELAPDAAHGLPNVPEIRLDDKRSRPDPAAALAFLRGAPAGQAAVIVESEECVGELDPTVNPELRVVASEDGKSGLVGLARR